MPRLTVPRLAPLADDAMDADTRVLLAGGGGRILNIFRTLAWHPKLLKRWLVFGNHVLTKSSLGARERELAILRVGWVCRAEYEWGQHVVIGRASGLTEEEIQRIRHGAEAPSWSALDGWILRGTDELVQDHFLSDATWQGLSAHWSPEQLLDFVFTVGQYTLVSMALNSLGVQLDPGAPGFDG